MALPKCEWRITVPTGGWSVSAQEFTPNAGPVTVTVAAGDYYLTTTNGANAPLTTAFATALTNNATLTGTYSCTLDDNNDSSVGKVTLSATGVTTFNITWTSTDLRDALGFTGSLTGALSYLGGSQARYLWLPNVGRAEPMQPEPATTALDLGAIETDQLFVKSPDGTSHVLKYNDLYVDTFAFEHVTGNKMNRETETVTNESLKRCYIDAISKGYPFRYHPDRSSDSIYFVEKIEDGHEFKPVPFNRSWTGAASLWSIRYRMGKSTGD